ncbi:MAG: HemX protein [Verrucomicrobiales bacterium]|jgi:HemX protein
MQSAWIWLLISTLFFLGGLVYVATALRTGRYRPSMLNMAIMACGFLAQCAFLRIRGEQVGRCPITTPSELLVFLSWSVVLLYFILGRAFRLSLLGAFCVPLVVAFQTFALILLTPAKRDPANDYWLEMHVPVSILSYGAFALAAVAGVMFFIQNRMLKRAQLRPLSLNLPDIRHLNQAIVRLIIIGLVLLTIGIASGFATTKPPTGLHLVISLTVWAAYAGLLCVKFIRGLASSQTALAAVGAFILAVVSQVIPH